MTLRPLLTARRLAWIAAASLVLLPATVAPAVADTTSSGADLTVAQTLGDRELTVVVRRVTSVPGPLSVDVITHAGTASGTLTAMLTPTGVTATSSALPAAGAPTDHTTLMLSAPAATSSITMTVDRAGPWELALDDGHRVARIPFVVPKQVITPPERMVYAGFITAGLLLLVSGVMAARTRRSGWTLLPAGGILVGLSMAATAAMLSASLPLPPEPGTQLDPTVDNVAAPYALTKPLISDYSRPPVQLTLGGGPLVAGTPADVELNLSDGSTGLPVDDLLVHDDALIHLLLVGPTGELWHLHPIRTAPGLYEQHLRLPAVGHYALSLELARRGGGSQLVRAADGLDVAAAPASRDGSVPAATTDAVRLGDHPRSTRTRVDGADVELSATPAVAGEPVTVSAQIGDTADLQPWLGMVGHLIVAGPLPANATTDIGRAVQSAPIWAHNHSMGGAMAAMDGPMAAMSMPDPMPEGMSAMIVNPVNGDSAPDETVAAYGPNVPFTFTFPLPGQYRLWIQVERRYHVLTVPAILAVAAAPAVDGGVRP